MKLELLASQLPTKDARIEGALRGAAALLDSGGDASLNPKLWPCEDSLALVEDASGLLALVADAHWGGAASEFLARDLARSWERASQAPTCSKRLVKTLLLLEARFMAERPRGDRSETTVLIAHLAPEGQLSWVNVGDSYLWRLAPGSGSAPELLNARSGYFLGNLPLAATSAWSAGSASLGAGEALLLASDGLEPAASGLQPSAFPGLLSAGPLGSPEGLRALADRAQDPSQAGGRDNLALIWIDPSQGRAS